MVLTDRQKDDLHRAIASYLSANGFASTRAAFVEECGGEEKLAVKPADHGQLEVKWTSVVRLTRKVQDLEARCAQLQKEVEEYATGGVDAQAKQSQWARTLPQAPPRQQLVGHRKLITSVAIHPVYNVCLSASEDATVCVWDLDTGVRERTLTEHSGAVQCVTFAPDGTLFATCSADTTIKLWNWQEMRCVRTLTGHEHNVSSVCFHVSPTTPLRLLSASRDESVRLWDPLKGTCLHTFTAEAGWVRSVSVSGDGQLMASAHADHSIRVWSMESKRAQFTLSGHDNTIQCIEFAPAATAAAIAGAAASTTTSATTAAADGVNGSSSSSSSSSSANGKAATGSSSSSSSTAAAAAALPRYLFSVSRDCIMRLWNADTGVCIREFEGHKMWIRQVTFHPGGLYVLTCADDKEIRVWDVTTGRCVRSVEASNQFVWALTSTLPHATSLVSARKVMFVSGDVANVVAVWDAR